MTDTQAT
jgi:hypothetical protein